MISREDLRRALDDEIVGVNQQIKAVLDSTDFAVRAQFRKHFQDEENVVIQSLATAETMVGVLTAWLPDNDIDRIQVARVLNTTLILQLSSFKLFMFGQSVASGALFRQVIEGVSLAFLFSVKALPFLTSYEADKYSGKNAVTDLKKHAAAARVNPAALDVIMAAYRFHHRFAHLSKLTVAATANFSKGGTPELGAHFDNAKLSEYGKEARNRARLAQLMPNAVAGVLRNLATW